jgi:hypothetical protein
LQFLRDKLIRDLEEGTKIFVYACNTSLPESGARELWQALQTYGPNRLLFVHQPDEHSEPGAIRSLEGTLVVGCIDQLTTVTPSFDLWFKICRAGVDLFDRLTA